jgi:serine phosphatase RsbU (regulator of sigma subunit)/catechol 2,3-dioxygenase-like lactoylglutathione lyase family enzyme
MASTPVPVTPEEAGIRAGRQGPYLRVSTVNIFVRDLERSLRFYRDQLGFEVAFDVRTQSGDRAVAVAAPDGGAMLRLAAPPRESLQYPLIGRSTQVTLLTEDVLGKFREWSQRGVKFPRVPRLKRIKYSEAGAGEDTPVWGGMFARFEDPDGNVFTLAGFDKVNRTIEARRREAAEKLEAEHRAARELEIARQVQYRLFPQMQPAMRTLEYAGLCTQARQVGGDYYDFLNLGQERLGLVLGDIAGKGMAAALLMANLQGNLRSQCAVALEHPERFLRSVNQLFCENTAENAYATLFFAEYDDRARRLRYANCGHPAALLFRSGEDVERLESTSTVLGLFADWDCEIAECRLGEGDALVLYSDGVTECCDGAGEEFGDERLEAAIRRNRELPAAALATAILEEVKRFSPAEQQDDITLIVAKCAG